MLLGVGGPAEVHEGSCSPTSSYSKEHTSDWSSGTAPLLLGARATEHLEDKYSISRAPFPCLGGLSEGTCLLWGPACSAPDPFRSLAQDAGLLLGLEAGHEGPHFSQVLISFRENQHWLRTRVGGLLAALPPFFWLWLFFAFSNHPWLAPLGGL